MVHTRWTTHDLTERLLALEPEEWEVVKLSGINLKGEALWPERFSLKDMQKIRKSLGESIFQALYQQEPVDITERTFDQDPHFAEPPKDLNLSRMIENRLTELELQTKLEELVRYKRMYPNGGLMYFGIDSDQIPERDQLKTPMPQNIKKIEYINVFSSEHANIIHQNNYDPLARNYHKLDIYIYGTLVHNSRYRWLVNQYSYEEMRGISVVDTIGDAIKAQDNALWSVTSLLLEMSVKVFKSSDIRDESPDDLMEYLELMRTTLSTQSVAAITNEESLERLNVSGIADSGLKQLFDFIFENLAGLAKIPKSRLNGQSHGVIGAGQYDLISYYDSVARDQELDLRPIIEYVIDLIVKEEAGDIYQALKGDITSLDWEFTFKPLWRLTEKEQTEVDLKKAQADGIYLKLGALSAADVRAQRFEELETFSQYESQTDFTEEEVSSEEEVLEEPNLSEPNTGDSTHFLH